MPFINIHSNNSSFSILQDLEVWLKEIYSKITLQSHNITPPENAMYFSMEEELQKQENANRLLIKR